MDAKELTKALEELRDGLDKRAETRFKDFEGKWDQNQKAIDTLLVNSKNGKNTINTSPTFGESFAEGIAKALDENKGIDKAFQNSRDTKISFTVKAGIMTGANTVTGDSAVTYGSQQGIVPNQKTNARDLIPSVTSQTGIFVSYRETGSTGSIDEQTEGNTKPIIDYDFTEVKTVSGYISGFARFSKQLMFNLPFLQNTLTRMLLRDFYKKENFKFWDYVAQNATGYTTTTETDDVKELIDIIGGRGDSDFNNSFILMKYAQAAALQKLTYTTGYYSGAGGVLSTPNGRIFINDVPVIPVSWAGAGKVAIIDADYIERVQTEDLKVEFSYEDSDNFQKNLVTARVECFENFNMLRTDAHSYFTI